MNIDSREAIDLLSSSFKFLEAELKETAGEPLFLELAHRCYDLSSLPDEETPAEIVKIS